MPRQSFRIRHGQPDILTGYIPAIAAFPSDYSTVAGARLRAPKIRKVPGFQIGCEFSDGKVYGSKHGTLYKAGSAV